MLPCICQSACESDHVLRGLTAPYETTPDFMFYGMTNFNFYITVVIYMYIMPHCVGSIVLQLSSSVLSLPGFIQV